MQNVQNPARGIALMILAILFFTLLDATAKGLVQRYPAPQVIWARFLGQTLIVTAGRGLVQHWGGPVLEIGPGDVVWIPPGIKHWHGATLTNGMSHIAFSEALDGRSVEWMEHVTDEQYAR